ncbi:MAG: GntR family transcriptional regulator [Sarcina sp.]
MIDKNSQVPAYMQLKGIILKKIDDGIWNEGDLISSERELSEEYSISRMTIRQALGDLVQEGYLVKKKGKGTFVCKPKVTQQDIMSFTEMISKRGGILENIILDFDVIKTPKLLKQMFTEDSMFKINRNRVVDGDVIANEVIYMPYSIGKQIKENDLKHSMYGFLESLNYSIDFCESSINAVLFDESYKKLFNVEEQIPLLKVNNKVYTKNEDLLFFEEAVYRSDKYTFEVNISKREGSIK